MSQCIGVGCWLVSSDQKVIQAQSRIYLAEHCVQVVLVETASWKGEQGCKVTSSCLKKIEIRIF